jgi:hypothetical protein
VSNSFKKIVPKNSSSAQLAQLKKWVSSARSAQEKFLASSARSAQGKVLASSAQLSSAFFFKICNSEGHYLAGSRPFSLGHQNSTDCQIFSKFSEKKYSTFLILLLLAALFHLIALTSSDRYEIPNLFFNHGQLILFSQIETLLIEKPV